MRKWFLFTAVLFTLLAPVYAQEATECEAGFRLFEHEMLATAPVCIPENPERIAPLDIVSFEFLLIHDIRPVITTALVREFFATTQPEWLPAFEVLTDGLPDAGFPANPEVVLAAQPDLIIGAAGYYDDNVYDEMAQIAPMIVYDAPVDTVGQNWKPNYEFIADALGMSATIEPLFAGYDERVAALSETLGDTLDGQTVSVVRAVPPDQLGLRLAGSFSGILLNDLGIAQPESQQPFYDDTTGFIQVNVSRESWQLADGDYLFVYGVQPTPDGTTEAQTLIDSLENDPIWNALGAVQNDRVYAVDPHWHGFGILAAHDIIDDLFTIAAGVDPAAVAPNPLLNGTAAQAASAECEAGFRLFEHELLATAPVCVPEDPQRIVALDFTELQTLLSVGVTPIGTSNNALSIFTGSFPEIADQVEGITNLGDPINAEETLALAPDLILGFADSEAAAFAADIAPTVLIETAGTHEWKAYSSAFAAAVNRADEFEEVLETYNARTEALDAAVEDDALEVSLIRIRPDTLTLYTTISFPGTILSDSGIAQPEAQTYTLEEALALPVAPYVVEISREELTLADGDVIFAFRRPAEEDTANWEALAADPLWSALSAVQNGRAYATQRMWSASGIMMAHFILDELFQQLTEVESTPPNPFLPGTETAAEETSGETRTYETTLGAVEIPADPQRIVVLNPAYLLDNVIALGVTPVGTTIYPDRFELPSYLEEAAADVERVGSHQEPNFEAILALDPDLILGAEYHEQFYEQLSAIAPTVLLPWNQANWQDFVTATGDVLNRQDEAAALLADYDTRAAELAETFGATPPTVSIVRVRPDALRLYVRSSLAGTVLDDVGLPRPEVQNVFLEASPYIEISLEAINTADADIVFVWGAIEGTEEVIASLEANPLWQTLEAVQNERVYFVPEERWFSPGILGVNLLLDDLETYITAE